MNIDDYRVIPGYDAYAVTCDGIVLSLERDLVLSRYLLNGYLVVNTFRGALTETLPVHRAVALAWVENPDPERFVMVNHEDGDPLNNRYSNLEWTDASGNNYHAVNSGLRSDNIPCEVRDFHTGEVMEFSSMAQAAEFMGYPKDTPYFMLRPKMFGKLLKDRFEFRQSGDNTPWFYESRKNLVKPSRYMVEVTLPNGELKEIYSTASFLKDFQLYGSPSKSIPALAEYASEMYPDHRFVVHDSYCEQPRNRRSGRDSVRISLLAVSIGNTVRFDSLRSCAKSFGVDRSTILNRLNTDRELSGWTFTTQDCPPNS